MFSFPPIVRRTPLFEGNRVPDLHQRGNLRDRCAISTLVRIIKTLAGACIAVLLLTTSLATADSASAEPETPPKTLNGFVLSPSSIPIREILPGGPERDDIPALDFPVTVRPHEAPWDDGDMMIGVSLGGEARAYPIAMMTWHELVNDTVGGREILVSFCPLCGTALVFDRRVAGKARRFGVSGLLYMSDLLMYDRETESLWSQIRGRAETGPSMGIRLELVRSQMTRWGQWKRAHPRTSVLSRETGFPMDYDRTPYGDYVSSDDLRFPAPRDKRYHPKIPTLGLRTKDGLARAYPASEVVSAGGRVSEEFAGQAVTVSFDREDGTFRAIVPAASETGAEIEVVEGFWFAWAAFHPETSVFTAPRPAP